MELPLSLPKRMNYLERAESGEELVALLVQEPLDLLLFLEVALADEGWSIKERGVIRVILVFFTYRFSEGLLAMQAAFRVKELAHRYSELIAPLLPKDIKIACGGKEIPANSLLFGMSSPYLFTLLREECIEAGRRTLEFPPASEELLEAALEFIESGSVCDLWKKEGSTLLRMMEEASDFELTEFVDYCATIYKRYIHRGNAGKTLKLAQQNGWRELKNSAIAAVNDLSLGLSCSDEGRIDRLKVSFQRFSAEALDLLGDIAEEVTDLSFEGELCSRSEFSEAIAKCPSLIGVSLALTGHYSDRLEELPPSIEELDLSMCRWLNGELLKKMIDLLPRIRILRLASNTGLDYSSWSLLERVEGLEELTLTRCYQLSDDDLLLIVRGCKGLQKIELAECSRLTEKSLFELAHSLPALAEVDLSRTTLSDNIIAELSSRCRSLKRLKLEKCRHISDYSLREAARMASSLREVDVTASSISRECVEELKKAYPHLTVIGP